LRYICIADRIIKSVSIHNIDPDGFLNFKATASRK
jgi:hypothetical protein